MNRTTVLAVAIPALVAGCALLYWLSQRNPVQPASDHTEVFMRVQTTGDSMVGFYAKTYGIAPVDERKFQAVVDTTYPFTALKAGDAIIYRQRFWNKGTNNRVHHAVYKRTATTLYVKGYANQEADGEVTEIDYIGKVTAIETQPGYFQNLPRN